MKLIVGLGNPGPKYASTRHNIGFMVVERLARELGSGQPTWETNTKWNVETAKIGEALLVRPLTFMNKSGYAVKAAADYYKLDPSDVWVIHDDIDLPLGKIRIRTGGASGGHNGVDSIIAQLKTDQFTRFRLGIGRGKEDIKRHTDRNLKHRGVIDFVLSRFHQGEAGEFRKLVKYGTEAVRIGLTKGLDKAQQRFN